MNTKPVVVNGGVALVLLAAAVGVVLKIEDPGGPQAPERTVAVMQGPVLSTVKAAGNLNAPRTVGLPFRGNPAEVGVVEEVFVKLGDTVQAGTKLARVDDRLARTQLQRARVAQRSARAQLIAANPGAQAALNSATIVGSIQQLANAQLAAANARERRAQLAREQGALVGAADEALRRSGREIVRQASAKAIGENSTEVRDDGSGPVTETSSKRTRAREQSITATSSSSSVSKARTELVGADVARAAALREATQLLRTRRGEATQASRELGIARATAGVAGNAKRGEFAVARAAVANAGVDIAEAKIALSNTVLTAPFTGTVVDIAGGVGETPVGDVRGAVLDSPVPVGPGSAENRRPATRTGFVTIADLTHRFVTANVVEADIDRVAVGQRAIVAFPSTGAEVKGTVRLVYPQESVLNNVVQYPVAIELEGAEKQKLGQSASVRIVTASVPRALSVPRAAIIKAGDQSILQVRRGKDTVKIPVQVGLVGDTSTEVTSPLLRPGDLVVLPGTGTNRPLGGGTGSPAGGGQDESVPHEH